MKDYATKNRDELGNSEKVGSSWSTCGTRRVTIKQHKHNLILESS